jgi:uncharacterized membrane protein YgdD (TMEM256/DUF423 family)
MSPSIARYRIWLFLGAAFGCLGVILGAFAAHGLRKFLGIAGDEWLTRQANWETAARYQMYHALALLAVGLLAARRCGLAIHLAGLTMTLGTMIFSGCLYALVLSGQKWLGAVVPIGGSLLVVGWVCLAIAMARDGEQPANTRRAD